MSVPLHPFVLLALPGQGPSREVGEVRATELADAFTFQGEAGAETIALGTFVCAPIRGVRTAGKAAELSPDHELWQLSRRMTGAWAAFNHRRSR